ncbi:hypothetical protein GOV04_05280 [Candidatus Woesearchaeota archaeon]|nr:hypothetical protein [Candidatus Woesearchaeota archaeon]
MSIDAQAQPQLKTWDDIESFDDIVLEAEREIIKELLESNPEVCPELMLGGQFFYFCGKDLIPPFDETNLEPSNPVYKRHQQVIFMQLYCMKDHKKCAYFNDRKKL